MKHKFHFISIVSVILFVSSIVYAETSGGLNIKQGGTGLVTVSDGAFLVGSSSVLHLQSTTSPTFGYITSTSTTATSTFTGGVSVSKLLEVNNDSGLVFTFSGGNSLRIFYGGYGPTIKNNTAAEITMDTPTFQLADSSTAGGFKAMFDISLLTTANRAFTFPDLAGTFALLENSQTFTGTKTFSNSTNSALFTGGNVGIGTTTPGAKLSVNQGSATTLGFYLSGYANATSYLFRTSTSTVSATSTAFVIDSNGKVGIGTTTPYTQLSVAGGIAGDYIQANQTTATSTFAGGVTAGNNAAFVVNQAATANSLVVSGSGKIGIGIASPAQLIDVSFGGGAIMQVGGGGTNSEYITMSNTGNSSLFGIESSGGGALFNGGGNAYATAFGTQSNRYFNLATNNIVRATISNTGNFGIGTTTFGAKLSINAISNSPGIYLAGYANTTADLFDISTSTLTATSTAFVINNNGRVGIGTTTPGQQISVAGSGYFTRTLAIDSLGNLVIPTQASSTSQIAVSDTQFKFVANNGLTNIVTGTTSPSIRISSTTFDAMGNKFSTATSTFLWENDPEALTLIGFYCTASTTGTAMVNFSHDNGNKTEGGSCTTGQFTRTTTNNTWTAFEAFNVQASSTKGNTSIITITALINKTGD